MPSSRHRCWKIEAVDVHRLGVRLDGDVLRAMTTLLDVIEELAEHVRHLWLLTPFVSLRVSYWKAAR